MPKIIKVGIADLKVTRKPNILTTIGLGSCVGVCFWDPVSKVAGMAHVMLPSSSISKPTSNMLKYADTAITSLIEKMIDLGVKKSNIQAKIVGGAHMFSTVEGNGRNIGESNVNAVKEKLKEENINLISEDTGSNYGRTIELYSDTGKLIVKTVTKGIKEL